MTKSSANNQKNKKTSNGENLHQGHRKRLRQQFLSRGLDSFYDHQALELLLYYTNPRSDTNPTAHVLLNRFGSISNILNADYEELLEVDGVGENTACLLKFLPEFFVKYMLSSLDGERLETTSDLCRYFLYQLATVRNEQLWLMCLDDRFTVVSSTKISDGDGSAVMCDLNKITFEAFRSKCTNCVLAHNHPFGDSYPSDDDIRLTECVKASLNNMNINLIDHIIVSRTEARSTFHGSVVILEDDLNNRNKHD